MLGIRIDLRKRRVFGTSRLELRREITTRERRLVPIVRRVMQQLRDSLSRPELRAAWAARSGHPGLDRMAAEAWEAARPALVEALLASSKQVEGIPQTARDLAERSIGELIRELTDRQLAAVRVQLVVLMQQGPSEAVLTGIARAAGLTPRQTEAVGRHVAQRLEAGLSEAAAARAGVVYAERLSQQRAQLIARTEAVRYTKALVLQRAHDVGGTVVKQWVSARDENVDAICRELDNGKPIPLEQPFEAQGMLFDGPPAHPGCRCVPEIWRLD